MRLSVGSIIGVEPGSDIRVNPVPLRGETTEASLIIAFADTEAAAYATRGTWLSQALETCL